MRPWNAVPSWGGSSFFMVPSIGVEPPCKRGLVHGSLKPTNVLLAENGQACISDYGMVEITPSSSPCGSYFSPEAWKGVCLLVILFQNTKLVHPQAISPPSDVFAFAMTSYEVSKADLT